MWKRRKTRDLTCVKNKSKLFLWHPVGFMHPSSPKRLEIVTSIFLQPNFSLAINIKHFSRSVLRWKSFQFTDRCPLRSRYIIIIHINPGANNVSGQIQENIPDSSHSRKCYTELLGVQSWQKPCVFSLKFIEILLPLNGNSLLLKACLFSKRVQAELVNAVVKFGLTNHSQLNNFSQ